MQEPVSGATATGRVIAQVVPLGLMAWAAVDAESLPLRACLLAWIVFTVSVIAATNAGWRPGR